MPRNHQDSKPPKTARLARFTDQVWARLTKDAAKEGIPVAEFLRRVVDMHYLRGVNDQHTQRRLTELEARMAKAEAAHAARSQG